MPKKLILNAFERGKQVVTANKALLSVHGEEIFEAAARHKVDIGYEASVGGGIPVVRVLTEGLSANRLLSVYGIINGTANYILTRMTHEGQRFQEALSAAQTAGYAEADPTFDIQGTDSVHKLSIMVNLAYGTSVEVKDIHTEGITQLTPTGFNVGKRVWLCCEAVRHCQVSGDRNRGQSPSHYDSIDGAIGTS